MYTTRQIKIVWLEQKHYFSPSKFYDAMSFLKTVFTGFFLLVFSLNYTSAQSTLNWCGQVLMDTKYQNEHPEELQGIINAEKQLEQEYQSFIAQRNSRATKVIPVVFHVVHQNGTENISEAQIQDQMRILNEDYNKGNADLVDVVSSFVNVIGDASIEFRLAQLDPVSYTHLTLPTTPYV